MEVSTNDNLRFEEYFNKFNELNCCVLVPTYNNAVTLLGVIEEIKLYTNNIIVVNDGATDATEDILANIEGIEVIGYGKNKGKGYALRMGMKAAIEKGYQYAISIDSDGQHYPSDLPLFLIAIEANPDSIIIGNRNMTHKNIPKSSSFGNKFSNFWFLIETGKKLSDTQSGYRTYPLETMKKMKFITRKFEFEIEVLVKAAWKGKKIINIPIKVLYAPKGERVTHFRPITDFLRISLLNTVLVIVGLLYARPVYMIKNFSLKRMLKVIHNSFINPEESDKVKTLSIMLGVFMGIVPIWGYQLVAAIFLAHIFKLNKPLVIIAANISIPPMMPILIYLSYLSGSIFFVDGEIIPFTQNFDLEYVKNNLLQYIVGSMVFAVIASLIAGLGTFIILKRMKRKKLKNAV